MQCLILLLCNSNQKVFMGFLVQSGSKDHRSSSGDKKKTIHVTSYYLCASNRVCLMISWEIINVHRPKLNPRQQVFNTNKSIAKRWFSIQFITRSKMKNTLLNSSGITFCLVIFKFDKFVASIQEQLYFCFILTRIFVNDIMP